MEDLGLSLAAKGLYAMVMAWPDDQSLPTEDVYREPLAELVSAGYAAFGPDGEAVVGLADDGDGNAPSMAVSVSRVPAPRSGPSTAGWAYAITDTEVKQVKIGVTQNVAQRLKGLQTGYPTELHVLWQGDGGAAMEAHLHARFARRRLRGEWFDFTGVDALKLITKAAAAFVQAVTE